jgi:hypothetical protein
MRSKTGVSVKHSYKGMAAASYWLIGGNPKISSIVLKNPEVEYIVRTGVFHLT